MAEAQKIRDRQMREIRKKDRIKCAKNIIRDLERHGPAGLIHLATISNIIGRPIKIWDANSNLNRIIGKEKLTDPIDIEYHARQPELGHWTLKYGKDPDNTNIDLNNCLFSVIGSQTGQDPSELRRRTVLKLKSDFRELVNWIDEILRSEGNYEVILMIGGAIYCGKSEYDAAIILDESQNQKSHGSPKLGHARGHAVYDVAIGELDSVQNMSEVKQKGAFLSRDDQNIMAHVVLISKKAKEAMNILNYSTDERASHSQTVKMEADELSHYYNNPLPKVNIYYMGVPITEEELIVSVIMVLRHHVSRKNDVLAPVFVQTFYPTLKDPFPRSLPSDMQTRLKERKKY